MATYQATKVSDGDPAQSGVGTVICYGSVTLSSAAANGDLVQFCKVPNDFTLVEAVLSSTDIDTNGSPTVLIDVGDAADDDGIFADSTIGRAGGIDRMNVNTYFQKNFTADTTIYATLATVATGATGTLKLALIGTMTQ